MSCLRSIGYLCAFLLAPAMPLSGASLKVAPGRFMIQNVDPGRHYDVYKETGVRLTIYNDDPTTRSWLLSAHRPSERGRWETGYGEIPDADWCWFSEPSVTVPPGDVAHAYLHIRVPEEEKYYNQHWIATLSVTGKPGGGGIALAVDVRVQIETKSKAVIGERPHGAFAAVPATVVFEKAVPGAPQKAGVTLYNNDECAHEYSLSSLSENKEMDPRVYLTQSYTKLPDTRWIETPQTVRLDGGTSRAVSLNLEIPEGAPIAGAWEDLILIRSDGDALGFIRVRVPRRPQADTDSDREEQEG